MLMSKYVQFNAHSRQRSPILHFIVQHTSRSFSQKILSTSLIVFFLQAFIAMAQTPIDWVPSGATEVFPRNQYTTLNESKVQVRRYVSGATVNGSNEVDITQDSIATFYLVLSFPDTETNMDIFLSSLPSPLDIPSLILDDLIGAAGNEGFNGVVEFNVMFPDGTTFLSSGGASSDPTEVFFLGDWQNSFNLTWQTGLVDVIKGVYNLRRPTSDGFKDRLKDMAFTFGEVFSEDHLFNTFCTMGGSVAFTSDWQAAIDQNRMRTSVVPGVYWLPYRGIRYEFALYFGKSGTHTVRTFVRSRVKTKINEELLILPEVLCDENSFTVNVASNSGSLDVQMSGASGDVFIDGEAVGIGSQLITDVAPGNYTVSYGAVEGFITPNSENVTITSGLTTTVTPTYVANPSCVYTITPTNSPNPHPFAGGSGFSLQLSVANTCQWSVATDDPWITIDSATSGISNGTPIDIFYTIDENSEIIGRTGNIAIQGISINIVQEEATCFIEITPQPDTVGQPNVTHEAGADTGVIGVYTPLGCSWAFTNNDPGFIELDFDLSNGPGGVGGGRIFYRLTENLGSERTGTITIGDPGMITTEDFVIRQLSSTCSTPTLGTMNLQVDLSGGGAEVELLNDPGCQWDVTANDPWITAEPETNPGITSGVVKLTVSATPDPRLGGSVTIAGQTVTIDQVLIGGVPPTANAGPDISVTEGALIILDGSGSFDDDGEAIDQYTWNQTGGTSLGIFPTTGVTVQFTAPNVSQSGEAFTFELIVEAGGEMSAPDTVTIDVTDDDVPPPDGSCVGDQRVENPDAQDVNDGDTGDEDDFGVAVAPLGTNKLVIGAPGDDAAGLETGSVWVYNDSLGTSLRIQAPAAYISSGAFNFGSVVGAVSSKVVVGAPNDNTSGTTAGAVYVFQDNGTLDMTIANPDTTKPDFDKFGATVAGLGSNQIVIGAPDNDIPPAVTSTREGTVYVIDATTGAVDHTIHDTHPFSFDDFGAAIATSGSDRIVVGDPADNTAGTSAGAVTVFDGNGNELVFIPNPCDDSSCNSDDFGTAVAVENNTILIGSPDDDGNVPNTTNRGAVYVYTIADSGGGNWSATLEEKIVHPETLGELEDFGSAVAFVGSVIAVGVAKDHEFAHDGTEENNAGAVYLFDSTDYSFITRLCNPSINDNELFGSSVGELNGELFVGVPDDIGNAGFNSGAVFLYDSTAFVAPSNHRPRLDASVSPALDDLTDLGNNNGTLVSDLLSRLGGFQVSDIDGDILGIAVISADFTNGVWEVDPIGIGSWFEITLPVSNLARLLAPEGRIRFIPNSGFTGSISNAIEFRAWDQTNSNTHPSGTVFDPTGLGPYIPFSSARVTASLLITAQNSAPVLDASGAPSLDAIDEDQLINNGTSVATLISRLGGSGITDADGDPPGIAVTNVDDSNGIWEYDPSGSTSWSGFGPVNEDAAVALDENASIRFSADSNFNGFVADGLTFSAWDGTDGAISGDIVDTTPFGGSTAFSVDEESASITVNPANDAPILDVTGTAFLDDVVSADANDSGTRISVITSRLGGSGITDIDFDVPGLAIVGVDDSNGTWQYQLATGGAWTNFGAVTESTAVTLSPAASIRFVSNSGVVGTINPGITFRAWDQSSGSNGGVENTTSNGGSTPFSIAIDTAAIDVIAGGNTPPVLDPIGPQSVQEGMLLSFTATATDSDLPPQTLVFSLSGEPAGAAITSNGDFTWTPTTAQIGAHMFDVIVSDGFDTDSETITVTVTGGDPNLIASYSFEGDAVDGTANGNDGTIFGATFVAGINGSGMSFDGVNDYVAIQQLNYNTVGAIDELTVCSWFNTTFSSGTSFTDNWAFADFDRSEYYNFYIRGDTGVLGFSSTDSNGTIDDFDSLTAVNDGDWHFACAVYDGTDKIIYIDGNENNRKVNAHTGLNLGSGATRFGFMGDGSEATAFNGTRNNFYYQGLLDEVKIYDRALASNEILDLFNEFPQSPNLIASYSFEGDAIDGTGNGNDGTIFGATFVPGINGNAMSFDGTNDYIAIQQLNYNTVGEIDAVTVCSWFNTTFNTGSSFTSNWAFADFDRSEYYNFFIRGDTGVLGFSSTDSAGTIDDFDSITSVNDGNWHFACAVYDGTDKIIYIDGNEDNRKVNAHTGLNLGTGNTRFGFMGDGSEASTFNGSRNNIYYQGLLDEVKIYDTALTGNEILDLFNEFSQDPNLIASYSFEGNANDGTGNGNDGTISGATFVSGINGNGMSFDGVNDFIAIQQLNYNTVGAINALTVCTWFNTTFNTGTSYSSNWAFADFDRSEYYNFYIRGDTGVLGFSSTDSGGTIDDFDSITSVNDGNWHFACAVYDGTDKIIYIDGNEDNRKVNAHAGLNLGTGNTRFGFMGDGSEASTFNGSRNNIYYQGLLDEVKIYDRVLTASEIQSLFNNP